jgi:hypothetical protein
MTDDLKDLFSRALAERPPLPSAPDMLARARAAERRRAVYVATGSSASAVAAIAAATVVVLNLSASDSGGTGFGSPPVPSGPPAPSQSSPSPPPATAETGRADVPMSHGRKLADGLTARLPAGYSSKSLVNYSDAPDTFDPSRNEGADAYPINAIAVLRLTSRGTEGTLTAYIARDRKPDPAGDLCVPEVAERVGFPAETCETMVVGDNRIRVTTATYAASGRSTSATLFLGDGWLTVTEHLGSLLPTDFTDPLPPDANPPGMAANGQPDDARNPQLADLPFTPQQMAEICATPSMVPR